MRAAQSLMSVAIGNSVTNIGDFAFDGCTNLTSITIPNSVTYIGGEAFYQCTKLTNVTIGGGIIGILAFYGCTSLTSITIGNSVTNIGYGAFSDCTSLTNIVIPKYVTSIGIEAFAICNSLTAIAVDTNNQFYSSLNGVLFDKNQTTIIEFPGGLGGSYMIPGGVTNIAEKSFYDCTYLSNITIPNSLTSIGNQAFSYCSSLKSVMIGNSVTSIGIYAFQSCSGLTKLFFQGNSPTPTNDTTVFAADNNATVYYLPGTTGWGSMFDGLPTKLWNPQAQTGDASFGVRTNRFGFNITGSSNLVIVVEGCTDLSNPIWTPLGTNTLNTFIGTNGTSFFSDPQWTNYPGRFYRLRPL